uniref:Uncharacterized protein n=1 Tax=Acrobeloides nanus TaxID=290746 RepID=A0A914D7H1_9BILA
MHSSFLTLKEVEKNNSKFPLWTLEKKLNLLQINYDGDSELFAKELISRLKPTEKLLDAQDKEKERLYKELDGEDTRIAELEILEEEQRIRDQQVHEEIRREKEEIARIEAQYAEKQRRKDEISIERNYLLKLIEDCTTELKRIHDQKTTAPRTRTTRTAENFEDSFKRIEKIENELKEHQNIHKSLLEKRDFLSQRQLELNYEIESYEQQLSEKQELKENLTDLMNEYKTAFEEIESKRFEYEAAKNAGLLEENDSIFNAFMKERQVLEEKLKRDHREMMEQKVQFNHLTHQLKEVKEELAHVEAIKKECSVPKEILTSRINGLTLARKKVEALSCNHRKHRKALLEQFESKDKKRDMGFEERMYIGQFREFDRRYQNLDKVWKERCKVFKELFDEVKKYEEYKELNRRKTYLKFKLQKKKELEKDRSSVI